MSYVEDYLMLKQVGLNYLTVATFLIKALLAITKQQSYIIIKISVNCPKECNVQTF